MSGKVYEAEEDARVAKEAAEKTKEEPLNQRSGLPRLRKRPLRLVKK